MIDNDGSKNASFASDCVPIQHLGIYTIAIYMGTIVFNIIIIL